MIELPIVDNLSTGSIGRIETLKDSKDERRIHFIKADLADLL